MNGDAKFQSKLVVVLVYRPPSGSSSNAVTLIEEKINAYCENNVAELIVIGDLNWDYQNRKDSNNYLYNCLYNYLYIDELCHDLQLQQLIEHPTRLSNQKDTLFKIMTKKFFVILCMNLIGLY